MRRIVFTASLVIFWFTAALSMASAATTTGSSVSVDAAADSSGVSITINQSSDPNEDSSRQSMSIIVSSASTDETLICTLASDTSEVKVRHNGAIDVTWSIDSETNVTFTAPSIRVAGILSNFTCKSAD